MSFPSGRPARFCLATSVVATALLALAPSSRAEPPVADSPLWTGFPNAFANIDIDPARPGVELPTFASSCEVSPPDGNGLITVTKAAKIKVYSADGSQVVLAPAKANTVTSGLFPDPRLPRFQCQGANVTNYRSQFPGAEADSVSQGSGVPVGPGHFGDACAPHTFEAEFALCDELPISTGGLSVAKVGGNRIVLLAQAINLEWHNNVANADINASAYSITAYSMGGTQLWTRAFSGGDADGYQYIGNLARVGDFLGGDGNDEIRLMSEGDGGLRYTYINPETGKTTLVVTPKPPKASVR